MKNITSGDVMSGCTSAQAAVIPVDSPTTPTNFYSLLSSSLPPRIERDIQNSKARGMQFIYCLIQF